MVLDEPFSGLDPVNANVLKDIILELKSEKKTILFSTHIMENAEKLCDKVCIIKKGKKLVDGSLKDVQARFGINTAVLSYSDGNVDFLKQLKTVEKVNDYGNYAEIRIRKDGDDQEILRESLKHVRIRHFEMKEPSLNEIFIHLVKGEEEEA